MKQQVKLSLMLGILMLPATHGNAQLKPDAVAPLTRPEAMPGDYFDIPQSAQLKVPLGAPAGPSPRLRDTAAMNDDKLGSALAMEAAQAAEAPCARDGYIVAVAVTDAAGQLKAALAANGTRSNGVYMAMHKAVTVTGFKMSTLELRAKIEKDPSIMARVKPNMSLLPGGMPILKGQQLIGAIATSGAAAYEEEKCARDGIDKISARL